MWHRQWNRVPFVANTIQMKKWTPQAPIAAAFLLVDSSLPLRPLWAKKHSQVAAQAQEACTEFIQRLVSRGWEMHPPQRFLSARKSSVCRLSAIHLAQPFHPTKWAVSSNRKLCVFGFSNINGSPGI
jgi:hypothetical protein